MNATRRRPGHIPFAGACPGCGKKFQARTATVLELALAQHRTQHCGAKPAPEPPQTRELFE